MFTLNSSIGDILEHPVGNDIITMIREQAKMPEIIVSNPIICKIKLQTIIDLSKGFVDEVFITKLCDILNQPFDELNDSIVTEKKWWKEAIAYQIYPRSFKDSNNDGIGDIGGIIEKLDYLKDLGINLLWLSPIYDSPNDDNGYDIRDYYKIMDEFGTMEDFDKLLKEAQKRDIKLIMDLVINHTSDEHKWFKEAVTSKDNPYRDFYIWKDGINGENEVPNNWDSFFSGNTWNYYDKTDSFALHLFSKKQMDLNWEHEPMRRELYKMINYWLDKGIAGFRLDVINFISKVPRLPEGSTMVGELMGHTGIENYFWGPKLHEYLQEMRAETFDKYDSVTVGETPGVGLHMSELLTHKDRKELDLVFSFDHLDMPGKTKLDNYNYDLNYLKQVYMKWQTEYSKDCWYTLFYDNHDNPRMLSKINEHKRYHKPIAKLLAVIQLTLKGTPFIYQGQELGLVNGIFESINDYQDIESLNLYEKLIQKGNSEEEALKTLNTSTRDHARIPIPWSTGEYNGFSNHKPWIGAKTADKSLNCESQLTDKESVYSFYKNLLSLRNKNDTLIYGDVKFINPKTKDYFAYIREGEAKYFVEMNLSKTHKISHAEDTYELIICSHKIPSRFLKAYESRIYKI